MERPFFALGSSRPLGPAKWNNVSATDFYRAVLEGEPYPMRGLVGFGSNLLLAFSDPLRAVASFKQAASPSA